MRITACLIARNEERYIEDCIAAIRTLTDDIVVVDTGSTDHTIALARKLGCSVYETKWTDDFSAARNKALEFATGDWILSIDADERLELGASPEAIYRMLEDTACQAIKVHVKSFVGEKPDLAAVFDDQRVALFRGDPLVRFRRRIHEDVTESLVLCYGEHLQFGALPISIVHLGYMDGIVNERHKRVRNIRLLELEISENGESAWTNYCLGTELIGCEKWEAAIVRLEKVVRDAPDAACWSLAAYSLGCCYLQLKNSDACLDMCALAADKDLELHSRFLQLAAEARMVGKDNIASLLNIDVYRSLDTEEDYFVYASRYLSLCRASLLHETAEGLIGHG